MNRRFFLAALSSTIAADSLRAAPTRFLLFLGTRSGVKGQGIYSCFFDSRRAECSSVTLASDLEQPTALVASANGRYLYSVSELGNDGKTNGSVAAFAIERNSGGLKLLNQVSSGGGGPTSLCLDNYGKKLLVANFGSGSTTGFHLLPDGSLGAQTASVKNSGSGPNSRQDGPHPHAVALSPDNRFALSADLGADRVFVFRFNAATGRLTPHDPPFVSLPAGSGPRQIVFHPSGSFAYLLNQLTARITVFAWSAGKGTLSEVQTLSTPASNGPGEPRGAGITVHSNGRFLYTTTRNDNAIEVFAIEKAKGTLIPLGQVPSGGEEPWSSTVDPTGRHLLVTNLVSNSLTIFRIDQRTGHLNPAGPGPKVPLVMSALFV